jgi:hypothetical protein
LDNAVADRTEKLSLGEKLFSIPVSIVAIVLGLYEFSNSGVTLLSVFPVFVGLENIMLIVYRKNPSYRRFALQMGIVLFTMMALFLVIN